MKIGRNDPCHCGSGVKYKKCHWWKESQKNVPDRGAEKRTANRTGSSIRNMLALIPFIGIGSR
jgi:hypothetical protein